jgi:hypothetical protein
VADISIALDDAFILPSTAPQMLKDMESSQDRKLLAQPGLAHADEAEDGVYLMVYSPTTTAIRCNLMSRDNLDL